MKISIALLSFLYLIFVVFLLSAQTPQLKCLTVKEGYIVKLVENSDDDDLTKSVDYFFLIEKPILTDSTTPIMLFKHGGRLLGKSYLNSINLERNLQEKFVEFDRKDKVISVLITKKFEIHIYRVLMAFFEERVVLDMYISKEGTSHSHSYLFNLSDLDKKNEVDVLYPEIVRTW